ncbi:MAG: transcription termination/antitermination protein NusG [Planctomycetota bacterium]
MAEDQSTTETEPTADASIAPEATPVAEAAPDEIGTGAPEEEPLVTDGMDWFVLRVASNKEDSVRRTLLRKVKIEGYDGVVAEKPFLVNRILVPTEKEKVIKNGKAKIVETKLYPGYVFVEMKLEDDGRIPQDVFFLIKETTGVGDFIGTAGRPSPMTLPEVEKMIIAAKPPEEQPEVKMEFAKGDHVKITDGPFENMDATVDETLPDQGKVRVIVTIFGRATPVELEYVLLTKVDEQ